MNKYDALFAQALPAPRLPLRRSAAPVAPMPRAIVVAWGRGRDGALAASARHALTAAVRASRRVVPGMPAAAAIAALPAAAMVPLARQHQAEGAALAQAAVAAPRVEAYLAGRVRFDDVLLELPPALAQRLLDIREAGMKAFFKSWSESIELSARMDKAAHKRRQKTAATTRLLAAVRAEERSQLDRLEALRGRLRAPLGQPRPPPTALVQAPPLAAAPMVLPASTFEAAPARPASAAGAGPAAARQRAPWTPSTAAGGPTLRLPQVRFGFGMRQRRPFALG